MADDIKIRVGVQSSVKADMDRLVRDMNLGAQKIEASGSGTLESLLKRGRETDTAKKNEDILSELKYSLGAQQSAFVEESKRLGSKSGAAFNSEFGGNRFKLALTQALRGNFSAALDTVTQSATAGGLRIAGALTAAFIGWDIGKRIDSAFGLSDKISKKLVSIDQDMAIKARADAYKMLREEAEKAREAEAKYKEILSETNDIIARNISESEGTPEARLKYESDKLESMRPGLYEEGITDEEKLNREKDFQAQVGRLNSASRAIEKQEEDERLRAVAEFDEASKKSWQSAKDAEEKKRAAQQASRDFEKEMAAMSIEDSKRKADAEIDGIRRMIDARKDALDKANDAAKKAQDIFDVLRDPDKAKAAAQDTKDKDRAAKRQARIDAEMEGRIGRGVTGKGIDDWLDMKAAERRAEAAKQEALDLAKKQAADIKKMADKVDALFVLKGGN
jgi:hypothetical protein